MPLEYEYRYRDFDKKLIIKKLKDLGATKHGHWIFRVQVFIHPNKNLDTYIRIRDEGHRITMTYKTDLKKQFVTENEIIIDDFDQGCAILLGIGCTKKYYYEKMREIWHLNNTEICWDTNPGRLDIMEIESSTKNELIKTIKLLELENVEHDNFKDGSLYFDKFGIIIPKSIDLTFENVKKMLKPVCKKNKKEFLELIKEQKKIFDKIKIK
jgi:predicted adenylyl cyclase CyaB